MHACQQQNFLIIFYKVLDNNIITCYNVDGGQRDTQEGHIKKGGDIYDSKRDRNTRINHPDHTIHV